MIVAKSAARVALLVLLCLPSLALASHDTAVQKTGAQKTGARHSGAQDSGVWTPSADDIATVEATVLLPRGVDAIGRYARYYRGATIKGHKIIIGNLIEASGTPSGIHIGQPGFEILGGGCSVITIAYDTTTRTASPGYCNGAI